MNPNQAKSLKQQQNPNLQQNPATAQSVLRILRTFLVLVGACLILQGCVHKVVTVPVKVAYKTTKGVVKGTAKAVKAIAKDDDKDD